MRTILVLFMLVSSCAFATSDSLYFVEHQGGINAGYLRSSFVYQYDSEFPQTEEQWLEKLNQWLSIMQSITVDNTNAVVRELLRCPNSRAGKPRYRVVDGAIQPTADVKDINIPAGFSGINPDGTLIPN